MLNADSESAFMFECAGSNLIGILHPGQRQSRTGVLIVVGGPQYRVGSHRQFLLLARVIAAKNIPVLRFDYRGMGDSDGAQRSFEDVGDDIRLALDQFFERCPNLESITLFGLCDGASASLMYAHSDVRVDRLVLVNPWVRSDQSEAKAYLKHYYLSRVLTKEFWRKLLTFRMDFADSFGSLRKFVRSANRKEAIGLEAAQLPLDEKMCSAFERFKGETLFVVSGSDLTAAEFEDAVAASPRWQKQMAYPTCETLRVENADHTFSRTQHRDELFVGLISWLRRGRAITD